MNIGERIQKIRKEKSMTQEELAGRIGVKRAVISKYENDVVNISIDTIEKIAKTLEVSPSYLIGYDEKIVTPNIYTDKELSELKNIAWNFYKQHIKEKNSPEYMVNQALSKLNKLGKIKAAERIEELTEIPKYTTPDPDNNDSE